MNLLHLKVLMISEVDNVKHLIKIIVEQRKWSE